MKQKKQKGRSGEERIVERKTPMDMALKYINIKARTSAELFDYLDSKEFGEYEIETVILRLEELGFVNDKAYAREFIDSRLRTKPISRNHLKQQLTGHKLDKELIDDALMAVDDETELENAIEVAQKFRRQFEELEPSTKLKRVYSRLIARGFSFDTSAKAIHSAFSSDEALELDVSDEDFEDE